MESAAQLRGRLADIKAAGADLVFVGNGSPQQARHFQERQVRGCPVYTDPRRDLYRVLGMRRGVTATLGPKSIAAGIRSTLKGHVQTSVQGDPWQQGGLLLLRPGGGIGFLQRNQTAADRPDLKAALAALNGSVSSPGRRRAFEIE